MVAVLWSTTVFRGISTGFFTGVVWSQCGERVSVVSRGGQESSTLAHPTVGVE